MSLILNIDAATETAMVCISENKTVLESVINTNQKDHASFLQPAIKSLLQKTNITFDLFNAISVTAGPGSYTGLRVGMASAKGLCYALNIPLITLNTLRVMALSSIMAHNKKIDPLLFCPMIDARRMEVFTAAYDKNLNEIMKPCSMILTNDSFKELLKNYTIIFSGSGITKCSSVLQNNNILYTDIKISAEAIAALAHKNFEHSEFSDIHLAEPFYLKEFYEK